MHHTRYLAVAGLLLLAGCEKRVAVVQRVQSQRALNTILVYFARLGLGPVEVVAHEARREKWWEIRIPERQLDTARKLLVALDLPRPAAPGDAGASSLIQSPEELAQRARQRLQRQLEDALEMYDGVVRAHVLIAPERRDPMTQKLTQPPSASVVVRYVADADAAADADPPVQPGQVQQIVAGAVSGLSPQAVQVSYARVTLPTAPPRPAPKTSTGGAAEAPLARLRAWIARYQIPILAALLMAAFACISVAIFWRRPRTAAATGT